MTHFYDCPSINVGCAGVPILAIGERHIDEQPVVGAQELIGRGPNDNVLVNEFVETAIATKI